MFSLLDRNHLTLNDRILFHSEYNSLYALRNEGVEKVLTQII